MDPQKVCFVSNVDSLVKSRMPVTPAKAGVHKLLESLDSRFRGNDTKGAKKQRLLFANYWQIMAYLVKFVNRDVSRKSTVQFLNH
jgi:hypothetical protein